jgi:methyl-accepting chemotaxis protein
LRLQIDRVQFSRIGVTIIKNMLLTLTVSLLAILFVAGYGLWQLGRSEARYAYVESDTIPALIDLAEATEQMSDVRALTLSRALTTDPSQRQTRDRRIADAQKHLAEILQRYGTDHVLDDKDRALLKADQENIARYNAVHAHFIEQTSNALSESELDAALAPLAPATIAVVSGLKNQTNYNIARATELGNLGTRSARLAWWTLALTALTVIVITGLLATQLFNRIRTGLSGLQQALKAVSDSLDLSRRVPIRRSDEIGQTAKAFNYLLDRVSAVLRTVRHSSDSVAAAASQIAAGNADLSTRTEEQAASLEETASSMEELTAAVQRNATTAKQVSSLTGDAARLAQQGHEVVERMVGTMAQIDESSGRISQISGIIEGIAFQTNILALNAAVESARAGEQGRAFAVVAGEVRHLAQKASSAAKDIKDLIALSVDRINAGAMLAGEAGDVISRVSSAVGQVAELVNEIALASDEQSRGIEQVGKAIIQMDEVTQQNAALVEEAAAAARSLEDQGLQLDTSVRVFRLITA